jgi:signal transduction histidine kinase
MTALRIETTVAKYRKAEPVLSLHRKEEIRPELTPEEIAYAEAQKLANQKVRFFRHFVVWGATITFFLLVAGFKAALIIGLGWGIGLASHAYGSVIAPALRRKWIDEEVSNRVGTKVLSERRAIEGRHARSLEELSASIAHEIRNPITAAKSLVQQMGEDPASTENVEYARVALEELDRVERSISHLLRFARDEDVHMQDMQVQDVIDSALETFRDRLQKLGVEVKRELDGAGVMKGDPEKMRRVIINLVGNALDALEEAKTPSPRVEIQAGENLARTEVWVRVRDNGPGIDPVKIGKIWNPFYTSKSNGTGLGLAISRKLVEAHGGTIEVRTQQGLGTEFTIVLPKAASTEKR